MHSDFTQIENMSDIGIETGAESRARAGFKTENRTGVEAKCWTVIRIESLTRIETDLKTGTKLGFTASEIVVESETGTELRPEPALATREGWGQNHVGNMSGRYKRLINSFMSMWTEQ
ncbi:hypothetical protein EVAR_86026_1 [Eumeta japonica]|uniref:Uncharacterized protein n=1 Tax=Eumeta variegata TaxID=151549 RepID=A0A4C1UKW3_EUMVA|nr:hypothetical protein EVAR_86026_1 [Eumeta japonica]